MKPRILYVNFDFPPLSGPGVWRALGFAKYLSESGCAVTTVCSDRSAWCPRRDETLLGDIPPEIEVKRLSSVFLNDLAVGTTGLVRAFGNRAVNDGFSSLKARALRFQAESHVHWGMKALVATLKPATNGQFDCVISSGPPHVCHVVGWVLAKASGMFWLADFRDLWTDDPAQWPPVGPHAFVARRIERRVLQDADAVVTVSPSWVERLRAKSGLSGANAKFHLIRNGHDLVPPRLDVPRPTNGRLHIHMNGTVQPANLPYSLLDAMSMLKETNARAAPRLTFTGMTESLKAEIAKRGLEEAVGDVGVLSKDDSHRFSLGCDALLVSVNNHAPVNRGTIPAKLYTATALGRHVLAIVPRESDVREVLDEYGNATILDVDDPNGIADALVRLDERRHSGHLDATDDARRLIREKYSRKALTRELLSVIEAGIQRKARPTNVKGRVSAPQG